MHTENEAVQVRARNGRGVTTCFLGRSISRKIYYYHQKSFKVSLIP
jgi:hypothetical protein